MTNTQAVSLYAYKNNIAWDRVQSNSDGNLKVNIENSNIAITTDSTLNTSDATTHTKLNTVNSSLSGLATQQLSKDGYSQVLLTAPGGILVKADSSCVIRSDPENREGWNCVNEAASTKFNLYFFGGINEIITLGEVESIYWKGFINVKTETASMPFITIHTKPTGINDAGPFFHSSITYQYANDDTIGIGEECVYYAKAVPATLFNNRKVAFNNVTVLGDGLNTEEVLYMSLHSDSGASVFAMNTTVNVMGFNTASLKRNLVLETDPITQNTDPVDTRVSTTLWNAQSIPDLTNATTASVDLLGYKLFQVLGNTNNSNDSPAKIEWSDDDITFYRSGEDYLTVDFDTGDFSYCKSNASARYVRFYKANGSGGGHGTETITLIIVKRKN